MPSDVTYPLLIQLSGEEREALERVRREGFAELSLGQMGRKLIVDDLVRMGVLGVRRGK